MKCILSIILTAFILNFSHISADEECEECEYMCDLSNAPWCLKKWAAYYEANDMDYECEITNCTTCTVKWEDDSENELTCPDFECPPLTDPTICDADCTTDHNCPNEQQCCSNGCALKCTPVDADTANCSSTDCLGFLYCSENAGCTAVPGTAGTAYCCNQDTPCHGVLCIFANHCPTAPACNGECTVDGNCTAGEKCCDTGCENTCETAVEPTCPPGVSVVTCSPADPCDDAANEPDCLDDYPNRHCVSDTCGSCNVVWYETSAMDEPIDCDDD